MSIWFFLWFILSASLLGFVGWTLLILLRQKNTWRQFAAKNKFRYKGNATLESPEMSGVYDGYAFSLFIAEHMAPAARSSRKLTALEFRLQSKLPFEAAIGSGLMVPVVQSLTMRDEYRPDHAQWDKNNIAASSSRPALQMYLTPARIEALGSLMKIRNSAVIFIFRSSTTLLRFDTPDPLETPQKLSKIMTRMVEVSRVLELKAGEEGLLKSEAAKKFVKEVSVAVDDRDFKEAAAFQLEEDKPPVPPADADKEKP